MSPLQVSVLFLFAMINAPSRAQAHSCLDDPRGLCSRGWSLVPGGNCVIIPKRKATFAKAKDACNQAGGMLIGSYNISEPTRTCLLRLYPNKTFPKIWVTSVKGCTLLNLASTTTRSPGCKKEHFYACQKGVMQAQNPVPWSGTAQTTKEHSSESMNETKEAVSVESRRTADIVDNSTESTPDLNIPKTTVTPDSVSPDIEIDDSVIQRCHQSPTSLKCPQGWAAFNNIICLLINENPTEDYSEAMQDCIDKKGQLATETDLSKGIPECLSETSNRPEMILRLAGGKCVNMADKSFSKCAPDLAIGHICAIHSPGVDSASEGYKTVLERISGLIADVKERLSKFELEQKKRHQSILDRLEQQDKYMEKSRLESQCEAARPFTLYTYITDTAKFKKCSDNPYLSKSKWIIFQRRFSGLLSFDRSWEEYKHGFGAQHGEFWLGLESLHKITSRGKYILRVVLTFNGSTEYAQYSSFSIAGESDGYRLKLGYFVQGKAGDSFRNDSNGMKFSTPDKDNDNWPGDYRTMHSCAQYYSSGWWFNACYKANLNGLWDGEIYRGVHWETMTHGYNADFTEMKIRQVN